jgi:hypothetical protein
MKSLIHIFLKLSALIIFLSLNVGCKKDDPNPNSVVKEDLSWRKIAVPNDPWGGGLMGSAPDGKVLLLSGKSGSSATQIYDPLTDKWSLITNIIPDLGSGNGSELVFLKSGRVLVKATSAPFLNILDLVNKGWGNPKLTYTSSYTDGNSMSGVCELKNGKVILIGANSIAVWNQKDSLIYYKQNYGSDALKRATVHAIPNTNRFLITGIFGYGYTYIYELDAQGVPKAISQFNMLSVNSSILTNIKSLTLPSGKMIFYGGGGNLSGTNATSPFLFDPSNNSTTRIDVDGGVTGGLELFGILDTQGVAWFCNDKFNRYRYDEATGKLLTFKQMFPNRTNDKPIGSSLTESGADLYSTGVANGSMTMLRDGNVLFTANNEAWISK